MRRLRRLGAWGLVTGAALAVLAGCASHRKETVESGEPALKPPQTEVGAEAIGYTELATRYNERVSRLGRVWASAVISMRWTDDKGKERWEQGEGFFQIIQPSRMAIDVRKLGELLVWLGSDDQQYWIIDAKESKRAYTGAHAKVTREKVELFGLPAGPLDLLELLGIRALPGASSDSAAGATVARADRGQSLTVTLTEGGTRRRYTIDARTFEPSLIEILDDAGQPLVSATLELYAPVQLRGVGGFMPRMASRIRATHVSSRSVLGLTLSRLSDGGKGRLTDAVFDFDGLVERLGIREIVDLDAVRSTDVERDCGEEAP